MEYNVAIRDLLFEIDVDAIDGEYLVKIDGRPVSVKLERIGVSRIYSLLLDETSYSFEITANSDDYTILYQGNTYTCKVEDKKLARIKDKIGASDTAEKDAELRSPMPGLIVEIRVKPGDAVKAGQGLIVVEAMKMENELKCPHDCVIKSIKVKEKEPVDQNQVLIEFE